MQVRSFFIGCATAFAAMSTAPAYAQAPESVAAAIPGAALCGEGNMTFMLWNVYDAALYAAPGACGDVYKPQALTLYYNRDLKGKSIADRSVKEMRALPGARESDGTAYARWREDMRDIFPDVKEGDVITGVHIPDEKAEFFYNGESIGVVEDGRFSNRFFSIWLSEGTSAPELRAALLGK